MANMIIRSAEKLLSAVQRRHGPSTGKIGGVSVTVTPLPENAFQISGIPRNGDETAFRTLADLRLSLVLNGDTGTYSAIVTWDTMLHRLVSEGTLMFD